MKGIYIAKIDENYSLDIGVGKKINGEIKALRNLGINMDYLRLKDREMYFNNNRIKKVIKFFSYGYYYRFLKKIDLDYDFAYIRYSKGNINLYRLIKMLSKKDIKIIIEIPTYPYSNEFTGELKEDIFGFLDNIITKKLKKYVFRLAVTNNKYNFIYGIKTIKINNGIDIENFNMSNKVEKKGDTLNLIGIANIAKWHGYDRVIKGISDYYKRNYKSGYKINFYIVGEGNEKENLINLSRKLNVENCVKFLGAKNGKELDEIFSNMDIGVSSLALFRAGGGHDPIKSKEFLARGIPVLLAYNDRLIDMKLPFVFSFDENETNINMNILIEKYKNIEKMNKEEIREYAKNNLSWETQMKKVVEELQNKGEN